MFSISSLYLRIAGYGLAAILLIGVGYKFGANHWEAKYQTLQAADWESKANREGVVRKALEGQLAKAQATSRNNEAVLHDLQTTAAAIVADRDRNVEFAHRLLANSARPHSCSVPQAPGEPAAAGAGEAGSNDQAAELLADAAAECRGNAAQMNSLIAEIKPQL